MTASDAQGHPRDALYCFTDDGRLRWTRSLDDRVRFASGTYGPPWITGDLRVVRIDGRTRVLWAAHHDVWWPSLLVVLDEAANVAGRFVHAGWITRVEASADGRNVLAAGVSNRRDAAVLFALDPRALTGAIPEPDSSPYRCLDCAPVLPRRTVVFPRREANQPLPVQHRNHRRAIRRIDRLLQGAERLGSFPPLAHRDEAADARSVVVPNHHFIRLRLIAPQFRQ